VSAYTPDFLSLLPPAAAIVLSLWSRRVLPALGAGIVTGVLVYTGGNVPAAVGALFSLFYDLLTTAWILKTLAFAVLVGSVMELMRRSGGIDGFVHLLQHRLSLVRSRRSALLLVFLTGVVIFIESSITALIAGAVGRPLAARFGFSREKLAYVCDSTAAPVCSLILINGWGALLLGLIATQIQAGLVSGDAVAVLMESVAYNYYAMTALAVTLAVIWFDWDIGPMRRVRSMPPAMEEADGGRQSASLMLIPLAVMVGGVFFFLWWTGEGNFFKGSGSSAVFYTMLLTLAVMAGQYRLQVGMPWKTYAGAALRGAAALLPIVAVLLLAFGIGKVIGMVGTGSWLGGFMDADTPRGWLAASVFLVASVMAFATGTSWGTFSIMLPIAVAVGDAAGAPAPLLIGAAVSGGVFGDHCSPISDTTIISSLAAGCDHIDHVRTQMPYALLSGVIALGMFAAAGFYGR